MSNLTEAWWETRRAELPRVRLVEAATPVQKLTAFGQANLWIKTEARAGRLFGGNKIRNLEYLIGDALQRKSTALVTFGAIESNLARATAIYGAEFNLPVELYLCNLSGIPERQIGRARHHLESHGAKVKVVSKWECFGRSRLAAHFGDTRAFRRINRRYHIPIGGASPTGCLGHLDALMEMEHQITRGEIPRPAAIVLPVGSGGTIAGLLAAASLLGTKTKIIGVRIANGPGGNKILKLAGATLALASNSRSKNSAALDGSLLRILDGYGGPGYSQPTARSLHVATAMEAADGVALDQTYSAKAFVGCLDYANRLRPDQPVLFWHTSSSFSSAE